MATPKEIKKHFQIALKEIGEIKPWFDESVDAWVFSHKLYPDVEYAGGSQEEVIKNYPRYLKVFIQERLKDNLAPHIEKATKGHGGKRVRAGRPKGTKKTPKKRIYVDRDIADWVQSHTSEIRKMVAKNRD